MLKFKASIKVQTSSNPRTGSQAFPEFFSDCSVDQLADFLNRAQPSCLSAPPSTVHVISVGPRCGNALLDPGEECDCGTEEVVQDHSLLRLAELTVV